MQLVWNIAAINELNGDVVRFTIIHVRTCLGTNKVAITVFLYFYGSSRVNKMKSFSMAESEWHYKRKKM